MLIVALCPMFIANAQANIHTAAYQNLKGNVRSIGETTYNAEKKFGDLVKGKKTIRKFRAFNMNGFMTQDSEENYTKGSKTTTNYSYDKNNNLEEENIDRTTIIKRIFNDKGDLAEENVYDAKGKLFRKTKCTFNSAGLNTVTDEYHGDGKLNYTTETEYNKDRRKIAAISRTEEKKIKYQQYYKYDDAGNIIEDKFLSRNDKGEMTGRTLSYVYNEDNQKERFTYTFANSKWAPEVTEYEYDDNGNVIYRSEKEDHTFSCEYTYDTQNNWTKAIGTYKLPGSEILTFEIIEREISYYSNTFNNTQSLEGVWQFEKMKLFDQMIYLDDTRKDKNNLVHAFISAKEMGMKADKKAPEEIEEMKKQVTANKDLIYKNAKDLYKGLLTFKGTKKLYDGNDAGKISFNYLNDNDKIERVVSAIEIDDNTLDILDEDLFEYHLYRIILKGNKLVLTAVDDLPFIIYYKK